MPYLNPPHAPRSKAALRVLFLVLALIPSATAFTAARPAEGFLAVQRQVETVQADMVRTTVALRVGFGSGSGVIISPDGLVLTAAHVIAGRPGRPIAAVLSDGRSLSATVVGADRESDLGLVKIEGASDLPTAPLGDSGVVRRRQWVLVTGHPLGNRTGRPPVLRIGRVLRLPRPGIDKEDRCVFTDVPMISGDSGGPLFDLQGHVVGINTMITAGTARMESLHVPVNLAKAAVERARKGEQPETWTGPSNTFLQSMSAATQAFQAADNAAAVKHATEAAAADATSASARLLLARALARSGKKPAAAAALKEACDRGFLAAEVVRRDPDLRTLAQDAAVTPILARLDALDQLVGQRKSDWPVLNEAVLAEPAAGRGLVRIRAASGSDIALGTILSADGDVLTKASELPEGALVVVLPDGSSVVPERGAVDPAWDIALLKLRVSGLPVLPFGEGGGVGRWTFSPAGPAAIAAVGIVGVAEMPVQGRGIAPKATSKAYMGVRLEPVERDVLDALQLQGGVRVFVQPELPAAHAGIRDGDVIFQVDGKGVRDPDSMMDLLVDRKPGDPVTLHVARGEDRFDVTVRLTARPAGLPGRGGLPELLSGDVSRVGGPFPKVLMHDAVLHPSQMGGPILDLEGRCIGMNIARADRTSTYAIPASELRAIYTRLKNGS
jgi:serine protease Do